MVDIDKCIEGLKEMKCIPEKELKILFDRVRKDLLLYEKY